MRPSRALRIPRPSEDRFLRARSIASWRSVVLCLALAAGDVHADAITKQGAAGANGKSGTMTAPNGTAGKSGQSANASTSATPNDNGNSATATGGNGGAGGNG